VPARTEAKLARKEASSAGAWLGRPLAGPTPELGCRGHELGLMSSGDSWLRLRSGRLSRLLGPGSRRRPRRRWPRRGANRFLRGGDSPTVLPFEAGSDSAEGGVDAEGAAAPPLMSDPAGTVYLVVCVCFLRPPRPKHIVVVL
jgi:hypothetical protein